MVDRILVDANSVGHAGHQGPVLRAGDQETQAIFATVKAARALRQSYPDAKLLFLWDGRSWRKDVCDTYKANRTDDPKKRADKARYKSQAPFIRRALKLLGVPQLFALNLEADDLAGILVKRYAAGQGDFIRLITGDRDWLQLVHPNVVWEDHRDDTRRVSAASFAEKTGYSSTWQYVQAKALQGDTSDNLPGVGKIGEKGASDLIRAWGDVRTFLADTDPAATYGRKLPKAFQDFRDMPERQEKFWLNMRMMNLLGDLPAPERLTLVAQPCDPLAFKLLCHELAFGTITANFDNWVAPFTKGTT